VATFIGTTRKIGSRVDDTNLSWHYGEQWFLANGERVLIQGTYKNPNYENQFIIVVLDNNGKIIHIDPNELSDKEC